MADLISAFYRNCRFRTKLMIIFVISSIIPIIVLILITSCLSNRNMTNKVDELMTNNLIQIGERINLNLELYTNTVYQIYQDELIIDSIKLLMDETKKEQAVAYNQINNHLKQYHVTDSGVRCISIICEDGNAVISDFGTSSLIDNLWSNFQDLRSTPPYIRALDEPGMVITPTMTFQERGGRSKYFHISKRIFDLNDLEQGSIATIVMSVDEQVLNQICNFFFRQRCQGIQFYYDRGRGGNNLS